MKQIFSGIIFVISIFLTDIASSIDTAGIKLEKINKTNKIRFTANSALNASVFLNDNRLWFIVDKKINLKFVDFKSMDVIKDLKVIKESNQYSVGYFEIINPSDYEFTSYRQGNELFIEINQYDSSIISYELITQRQINKNIGISNSSLDIGLNLGKRDVVHFIDEVTGEEFFVIPEFVSSKTPSLYFVDFEIVESLSGLVIKSLSDNLKIVPNDKYVSITSSSYLNLSPNKYSDGDSSSYSAFKLNLKSPTILDFSMYQTKPEEFLLNLSKINQSIYNSYDKSIKGENIFNLSLFLLTNRWYSEAKSMLELVNRYSDIISSNYKIKLIVGAIYFMSDSIEYSVDMINSIDMNDVEIKNRSEVRFWKNLCWLVSNDKRLSSDAETLNMTLKKLANKILDRKNNFVGKYNNDIFNKITSKIGEIAIRENRSDILRSIVLSLSRSKKDITDNKNFKYLNGKLLASYGDYDKALDQFKNCMSNFEDRYYYSKCKFEALNIMQKTGKIDKINYINNLQGISTVWRGDNFELEVLEKLGQFYYENNQVADAIRLWKIISMNNPGSYDALTNTKKAAQAFIEYLQTSNQSKIDKLAFFYEFQDLIPLGEEGDKIIMQTSSYMIDLDMFEQATKVIEYQIKNRLIGISREDAINELSEIYIGANKCAEAEKTITSFSKMPLNVINPIIQDRKYLYVESLIGCGQMQDAIALLYGDLSPKGDELRAKALFKLEDWNYFNESSEPYLYSIRYKMDDRLNDNDYIKILKQNISYFNLNQMKLLDDLYLDMKPRFKKGQKNAERNRLFYNIANELKDGNGITEITGSKKARLQSLIQKVINS